MDAVKNFAKATVADLYTEDAVTIVVETGQGARFPATPFNAVWWNSTDYPDPSDDPDVEIVRVTNNDDDILTVTRAQEGTFASNKNLSGRTYKLIAGLTAAMWVEGTAGGGGELVDVITGVPDPLVQTASVVIDKTNPALPVIYFRMDDVYYPVISFATS